MRDVYLGQILVLGHNSLELVLVPAHSNHKFDEGAIERCHGFIAATSYDKHISGLEPGLELSISPTCHCTFFDIGIWQTPLFIESTLHEDPQLTNIPEQHDVAKPRECCHIGHVRVDH